MTQSQVPSEKQKLPFSGLALVSLILGLFFFIPIFGLVQGILAIIFGVIGLKQIRNGKSRGKQFAIAGISLGIIGILFTVGLYGVLFYFGYVAKSGAFIEVRKQLDQQALTTNVGALELYKQKYGKYPQDITDLSAHGYTFYPSDAYGKAIYYKIDEEGGSYEIKGLGADGIYNTTDDVLPK